MNVHALLNLLNELGKRDKLQGFAKHFIAFSQSLINTIIQEHECLILLVCFVALHHSQQFSVMSGPCKDGSSWVEPVLSSG